jgi:hypothetical protein
MSEVLYPALVQRELKNIKWTLKSSYLGERASYDSTYRVYKIQAKLNLLRI